MASALEIGEMGSHWYKIRESTIDLSGIKHISLESKKYLPWIVY